MPSDIALVDRGFSLFPASGTPFSVLFGFGFLFPHFKTLASTPLTHTLTQCTVGAYMWMLHN